MSVKIKGTNLVYFPVPKIACTSLKTAIMQHNSPEEYKRLNSREPSEQNVHEYIRSYKMRPWTPWLKTTRDEWVCIVRDPIKRAVSGYRNRIMFHKDLDDAPQRKLEAAGLTRTPSLNEFALNIEKYIPMTVSIAHHFRSVTRYIGKDPGRFAHVFDLSQLDDFVALVNHSGVHLEIPHEQTGGPKLSVSDLSPEAYAALRTFYAEDYRIWGQYFS
ncbi:sulfotransferase family 2 domain-containing protein [Roseovarius pacificus]|uniref:sulfotransferase family 2 domain-containing protein n=1 Tax=Roseovarius pacificus TaxID=337701 RepID=UPI00403A7149